MRNILLAILLACFVVPGWAKTYSCRDSQGQLHFSDNLNALPAECQGEVKTVKPGTPDNLNFVPPKPEPPEPGIRFRQSVENVKKELQQEQRQVERLREQARELVARYRDVIEVKVRAKRSSGIKAKRTYKQALKDVDSIRAEKQRQLEALEEQRMARDDKRSIVEILTQIPDEQ